MAVGNRVLQRPYPVAMNRIQDLANLQSGWNGKKAVTPAAGSLRAAEDFLSRVWNELGSMVAEPTVVTSTSDGGVALEWIVKAGDREKGIEVVFLPKGNEYSVRDREAGRLEESGENVDSGYLVLNVIKSHVAGRFILAR